MAISVLSPIRMLTLLLSVAAQAAVPSSAPSLNGSFCGSVPLIIDNTITFHSDAGTADLEINVKIAHQKVSCKAEATSVASKRVTFPHVAQQGDCMGDSLRAQGKDPTKFYLDENADGTLTFHSDGYPGLKLKPCTPGDDASAAAEAVGGRHDDDGAADAPCCSGACRKDGEAKYYSIAKSFLGKQRCGECCMRPELYPRYHLFEKNLTRASSASPCAGFGYGAYYKTETHGFGPIQMTVDLYDRG